MHRITRALSISKSVKDTVWKRDGGCCVLCGSPRAMPNAHYISRAQGGLGIERNIATLCRNCHRRYDQTADRAEIRLDLREYLESKYPDWDESQLIYQKGE